jgi:protein SCO1/2
MEDWMSDSARARIAVGALAAILAITASWWALALWPAGTTAPEWVLRTREVCFGTNPDGLPEAGGWILLIGQPIGMLALLVSIWPRELRAGFTALLAHLPGQLAIGAVAAAIVAGILGTGVRVRTAGLEPFSVGGADLARQLTRVNDAPAALALTDQTGAEITLESFRGRPVLVTFAYAHCETVCPRIVDDVLEARLLESAADPAVIIVTLDPWRDTPSRLPTIAQGWSLGGMAHVLSGDPERVERTLNAWRVPRVRNESTGAIAHPSVVYVIDRNGRIAYVVSGDARTIVAAIRAL